MSRIPRYSRAVALALLLSSLPLSGAFAHCFVGARFFPATLVIDDPCVADEMSLPTVDWFKTGGNPPASQVDISAEFDKRITEDLGFGISDVWTQIRSPGGPIQQGFGESRNHAAISVAQRRVARIRDAVGPNRRLGRYRQQQRRNSNTLFNTHADLLFRPRFRRNSPKKSN